MLPEKETSITYSGNPEKRHPLHLEMEGKTYVLMNRALSKYSYAVLDVL